MKASYKHPHARTVSQNVRLQLQDSDETVASLQVLTHDLKRGAYERTLASARTRLSRYERMLSKWIHHPTLEPVLELVSYTLGRASGVLGGAMLSFFGSL